MSDKTPASRHAAPRHGDKNAKPAKPQKPTRYKKSVRVGVSILSVFMTIVSLLMITAGGYIWNTMSLIRTDDDLMGEYPESLPPEEDVSGETLTPEDMQASEVSQISVKGNTSDVTNLLLLGLDGRTSYKGSRSDTMMIVSINSKDKTIKLISLLRDTLVTIPGRDRNGDGLDDYAKLNAAFAYGGFDLLSKTIEQNFRLKIDKYIGVNFVTFPIAVDALGGIEIYMTAAEAGQVCQAGQEKERGESGFRAIGNTAQVYSLNGYQALQYARIRKIDSDFGRTNRQRKVIEQLMIKAKAMNIGTLNSILRQVLPEVLTNMSADELMGYAMNVGTYANYTIDTSYHLPEDGGYQNKSVSGVGATLQLLDPPEAVRNLHQWIYG